MDNWQDKLILGLGDCYVSEILNEPIWLQNECSKVHRSIWDFNVWFSIESISIVQNGLA